MNTETPSPKKYLLILIILVLSGMTLLALTALYIQPIDGNLTRMGGYSERDFGWTIPQKSLVNKSANHKTYDKYYDIVVYGDSFSKQELWQSFLSEKTGFSFLTLYWDETPIEDVLSNPTFISNPPKLFIFETGEGAFQNRFLTLNIACESKQVTESRFSWNFGFIEKPIEFVEKNRNIDMSLSDINFKFAFLFLKNSLFRYLFNDDFSEVIRFSLTRNDLFSNNKSEQILLLRTWFDSKLWNKNYLEKSLCAVTSLQNSIQSNGSTLFILLSIPDKSNAYRQYIANYDSHGFKSLAQQLIESKVNYPRLDILVNNSINGGEKDVYLPNDTHFGTRGYELAAKSILDFLKDIGVENVKLEK